ncbi:MAG: hypothetical protein Q4G03_01150 [Planctomycetia bacterium]|nr:hypothetical protein [Planctomycetia bacterium]
MANFDLNDKTRELMDDLLGNLNFSSGRLEQRIWGVWNDLFFAFEELGSQEIWRDVLDALTQELDALVGVRSAFADSRQARGIIELAETVLKEYLEFHRDALFHIPAKKLYNSFFLARVFDFSTHVFLSEIPRSRQVDTVIERLNDYIGYRPIPVFEDGQKHEPNKHEWVAPVPLYREGVGVAQGEYCEVIQIALSILRDVDQGILEDASFDPQNLLELAFDPRPYDFDHPVNMRMNYSFGTWDDRSVDNQGAYRRFILQSTTLDAIMGRVWGQEDPQLHKEYQYEAAAIVTGTMLMASAVCGGYVQAHDSETTIEKLIPVITRLRDLFYERLIVKTPASHKERLTAEVKQLFQPFAGARHALNRKLAELRSDQLQRFALARTYARMGYYQASQRQTEVIRTASSRLLAQIDCLITEAHLDADNGELAKAAEKLPTIEDLLHRGLACGAFPDPWYILGFDAQFSLFPSPENSVHDHRLDGLVDIMSDIFDLYGRLEKESAACGLFDLYSELSDKMSDLASWWDQFASDETSSVDGFSGQEVWESATKVANALAAWSKSGKAIGDVAFWSRHVERFKSPKAFVLLAEALLEKNDLISTSSLLIYWLSQSSSIALTEGDYSFLNIAYEWLVQVWQQSQDSPGIKRTRRRATHKDQALWSQEEYLKRWNFTKGFIDRVEANAGEYWSVSTLDIDNSKFRKKKTFKTDNPILAEYARRLIAATRKVGENKLGLPNLEIKSSFKDAARVFDESNFPSLEEFQRFYDDNKSLFPSYLTFVVFMQITLQNARVANSILETYTEALFEPEAARSITVSSVEQLTDVITEKLNQFLDEINDDSGNEKELGQLWNKLVEPVERAGARGLDVRELVRRAIDDDDEQDENESKRTKRPNTTISVSNNRASQVVAIRYVEDMDTEWDEEDLNGTSWNSESDEDEEERFITGVDPTFNAAYDNMTYRDSADDGNEDDVAGSNLSTDADSLELSSEAERLTERLAFISWAVNLWKIASEKSPLLNFHTQESLDDQTIADARLRLEGWLNQTKVFRKELFDLLDKTSRYIVSQPNGTAESLAYYDQLRGSQETLLERIAFAIGEVDDVVLFLNATLRNEVASRYEKAWKTTVLEVFSAILRRDSARVRCLWPKMIAQFEKETLLYIPSTRGGDVKANLESRYLHQVVTHLLDFAPRLGLLTETFQLVECVQKMEQNRLASMGSITEYDRIVEVATRSLVESLAESSKTWRTSDFRPFEFNEAALAYYLEQALGLIYDVWLSHSAHIRVTSAEAFAAKNQWITIVDFIKRYGSDLFTQSFLSFRTIRAILHHGARTYLMSLMQLYEQDQNLEIGTTLACELSAGKIPLDTTSSILGAILECIGENYSEYVDYNSTTTQSDDGAKLYILLDFLRLLAKYERISWNMKPAYWCHDALIRADHNKAAELWKERFKHTVRDVADRYIKSYDNLTKQYGVWLQSVHERLSERFVRPLEVAQMCGLVFDAITQARTVGEDNEVFKELERMVESFAAELGGVTFELPSWLQALQDEVIISRVDSKEEQRQRDVKRADESIEFTIPITTLSIRDLENQLIKSKNK